MRVLSTTVSHAMVRLAFVFLVSVLSCATVFPQGSTAQMSGTVKDQSGAVLPGVEITVTQTATGLVRSTLTNETGSYTLPNLPVGPYRLEAALSGFRTYVRSGVVLEVSSNPVIHILLDVGQVAETVEVQANAALVETRTVGVGQIMENERILELPLNGRNVTELITLQGGAVQTGVSSPRSMPGQQEISVAGGLSSGVAYSLDGAIHNNPYDNLSLPLPFPDALQEFKVETSALSASQGQHSGAQVNAVTRSGTNDFHGSLFEFLRNDLFNATTYKARVDSSTGKKVHSTLKRNQFGGTIGGPIIQNRVFFFGGYQGSIFRQDPADRQSWVPTEAMLRGDFRTAASAACGRAYTLRAPFVNNQVNPALFSPAALNLSKRLPAPQDECGFITWGVLNRDSDRQIIGKTDWQINPSHSFIGRVLFTGNNRDVPHKLNPENLLTVCCLGWDNLAQSYTVGDTWLASPSSVVSGRLAVNYTDVHRLGAQFFNASELGVKNYFSHAPKYSQINVSAPGFGLGGGTQSDSTFRTFSSGLNVDASLLRGTHQWAVGGALSWIDSNSNAHVNSPGTFSFTGKHTTFPMADFLLGRTATLNESGPNTDYMRKWYMAVYLADTWKLNPNWTLNYGVRWEPDTAETLTLARVQTYSEDRRVARIRSTQFINAPLGFSYPGDPGFKARRGRDQHWSIFAPRFGFAWDVNGDGRTSIRASAGIAYDYPNAQFHLWTSIAPPWGLNVTVLDPIFDDPWVQTATYPGGNPFPASLSKDTPYVAFGGFTTMGDIEATQVQNWNLSVQRQFGNDWLVSASYLGSHTIHMLGGEPLNPAIYFPGVADANGNCLAQGYTFRTTPRATCSTTGNTNQRRRLSLIDFQETGRWVGSISEIQSGGNANYNGLLLNVRKRATEGITLSGNYTWSHCIGPFQATQAGGTGPSPTDTNIFPGDRDRGRGNCPGDRRHVTNLTGVFETP
ncbi:MAG: TonB-dependent receptor, partial [Acidobacteria bacterium]|nr:TonB-dependent receptor [Acidobacteriota bacterium]